VGAQAHYYQFGEFASGKHREKLRDPDSEINQQPDYAKNENHSIKEEFFVAVGICTHLGCVPNYEPDGRVDVEHALFFCPCNGSKFGLADRVFENVSAPTKLIIPLRHYTSSIFRQRSIGNWF
tara:strand:- start:3820 stop:4188 length:369 start_codon:yes stop_codon:yes gene_type:complete